MTVKDLYKACAEQIKKGNGNKEILISSDDEGNSYHGLFYEFNDNQPSINELAKKEYFHDDNDPNTVILLG